MKTKVLIIIAAVMLVFASCGSTFQEDEVVTDDVAIDDGSYGISYEEAGAVLADGEATFKERLDEGGTHIWYYIGSDSGKDSEVYSALVFEDGQVTIYDSAICSVYSDHGAITYTLGKLGDFADLSDEDAIKLIQERYLEAETGKKTAFDEHAEDCGGFSAGSEVQATYDEISEWEPTSTVEPSSYELHIYTDETGNSTDSEFLKVPDKHMTKTYEYWVSILDEHDCGYEKGFRTNIDNMEIYNSYFGGYEVEDGYNYEWSYVNSSGTEKEIVYKEIGPYGCLVTRCDPMAVFMLDDPSADGVLVDQ